MFANEVRVSRALSLLSLLFGVFDDDDDLVVVVVVVVLVADFLERRFRKVPPSPRGTFRRIFEGS